MSETITCPRCGLTSHNPNDVEHGYCGACHWWTSDPILGQHEPPDDTGQSDATHAGNVAYRKVLAEAGYTGDPDTWPSPGVPTKIMRAAIDAGERAREGVSPL